MAQPDIQELLSQDTRGMALLADIGQAFAASLDIEDTLNNAVRQILDD